MTNSSCMCEGAATRLGAAPETPCLSGKNRPSALTANLRQRLRGIPAIKLTVPHVNFADLFLKVRIRQSGFLLKQLPHGMDYHVKALRISQRSV